MARILLVDDDPGLLRLLTLRLEAEGFEVLCAESGAAALGMLDAQRVDLVISDLRLGDIDGLALFDQTRARFPGVPVIIITAQGSIPEAVAATQKGVFGFLTKPVDKDELLGQIRDALSLTSLGTVEDEHWRDHLISRSEAMEQVLSRARLVAASDVSVLITGGSGSGKELLAQAIHRASERRDNPFVPINCGALPEALLESELFGHVKGAFTGALRDQLGLFRAADGGTLFLDEIGDMPLTLQVSLLRVLQERQVRPVGSTESHPVDVRVISATHRDLEHDMEEGGFRQDLFYRLNVVNLELPPLSARREDISLLATHFLHNSAKGSRGDVRAFSPDAMALLVSAPWPGNVRQLENVVQQTVALAQSRVIPESLVREALTHEADLLPSFNDARHQFERDYLVKVLKLSEGNVTQAARIAQRNRTDFYKLMQRHKLSAASFKS
ncbi:sigma 54-interacting transcriptional regulator [Parahaliea mediterranea]|uniref:Sigma 54-interacting transcriptional regulator n=1 Tax=Parahaliea mediterranea TaxID=651086 RepID=A0A939DIB4_9GAMM|nr:sigma 54-interacting transcriptional regulator [Parahaliea mediterranea]